MRPHPLELLTKAVTAEPGSVYENIGAGRQKHRTTKQGSAIYIWYALAGMEEDQVSMLLLKYGDGGNREWLRVLQSVCWELQRVQNERRLRNNPKQKIEVISGATLHAIAVSATEEYMQTRSCKRCHGTRETVVADKKILCENCAGNGVLDWTAEERARAIGVSRSTYYRLLWLYMPALQHLRRCESEATAELCRRMK